jgi:2-oxoglutarate ferredoxin oxidoreductase subunit alpha
MKEKVLMEGNEALAEGAIRAGCRYYFGYPITPQSEVPEYLAKNFPKVGGVFLQMESEIASINAVYGAASAGARVMTSSSSPGISLKQEGISYIAACHLPCLIVNVMRGGPGLGNIAPAQADYFQATKGGGHGDYNLIVLAPATAQEMAEFPTTAFELADKYRTPVMILADGILGQMIEPVSLPDQVDPKKLPFKEWATTGTGKRKNGKPNIINSVYLNPVDLEEWNKGLQKKYEKIKKNEVRFEKYKMEDADVVFVAFGIMSRVVKTTIDEARKKGIKAGLIRPVTLWPFPYDQITKAAEKAKFILTVEMNAGQMVEDVKIGACGKCPVHFYGKMGGVVPLPMEILKAMEARL